MELDFYVITKQYYLGATSDRSSYLKETAAKAIQDQSCKVVLGSYSTSSACYCLVTKSGKHLSLQKDENAAYIKDCHYSGCFRF